MDFVKNIWYVAAWSNDVVAGQLFHRVYLDEPILIFRKRDGAAVAIGDRCPHRFAPLHLGKLLGDTVECPYHGLTFDCTGACTSNPHGKGAIPRAATTRAYPLTEMHNLLWIWMGEPSLADPETIPDFSFLTDTEHWSTVHGYLNLKANYQIVIDNLTDLSHAPFVHDGFLESRDVCKGEFKTVRAGDRVETRNWCPGIAPPPFFSLLKTTASLLDQEGLVDHWQDMSYEPPGCMVTYYGITPRGKTREEGIDTYNPNFVTPESATKSHYFWAGSRNFDLNDSVVNEMFRKGYEYAFEHQDRPILEAQQEMLGNNDLMTMGPVMLINDGASVHARRVMAKRLLAEQSGVQSESVPRQSEQSSLTEL